VKQRVQFGKPLADFQITQARIAEMATAIDAAALLVYRAAWTRDRGAARVTREAAMAKLVATETAQQVIDGAVQLLGARGVVAGRPGGAPVSRDSGAADLRRHERDSEARDCRTGVVVSVRTSAHVDTFVRDHLPPRDLCPNVDWSSLPELSYPDQLNAAALLLDTWIERGLGDRPVLHHADGTWSYRRLFDTANRVASVLVDDLGLVPGGRVLLRAPNHPWLVACWFGVIKAGGVAVTTMPLLRVRELGAIIEQAQVRLAITDARVAADLERALAGREGARVIDLAALESMAAAKGPTVRECRDGLGRSRDRRVHVGTTGRSKGTVHTHRDLLAVTDTYGRHVLKPEPDDIFIGSPPIAFTYALGGLVLFPMRFGASTALIEQASPPQLLEGIQRSARRLRSHRQRPIARCSRRIAGFD
jgi:2-aminobenzoate-CoA ligase